MAIVGMNENDKIGEVLLTVLKALLIGCFVWMCIAMCAGCKSIQTETQINYHDSTIMHHRYDTTRITITDTLHVEASAERDKESETEIVFGHGGGTWNAVTGEATNVANVKQASRERELQKEVTTYKHVADSAFAMCDSLYRANHDLQEQIEQQQNTKDITPRSGWDRFTTWWFIGSVVVLLLLLAYGAWRLYRKYYLHI